MKSTVKTHTKPEISIEQTSTDRFQPLETNFSPFEAQKNYYAVNSEVRTIKTPQVFIRSLHYNAGTSN
jgi:hypothetical protein